MHLERYNSASDALGLYLIAESFVLLKSNFAKFNVTGMHTALKPQKWNALFFPLILNIVVYFIWYTSLWNKYIVIYWKSEFILKSVKLFL